MRFKSLIISNQAQASHHFFLLWFDLFAVMQLVALLCCRIAQQGMNCQSLTVGCRLFLGSHRVRACLV